MTPVPFIAAIAAESQKTELMLTALFLVIALTGCSASWKLVEQLCEDTNIKEQLKPWCCTKTDRCEWPGVECHGGELVALSLSGLDLSVEIPRAFYAPSPFLRRVSLRNCGLKGPIAETATEMLSYSLVDLSSNALGGSIPRNFLGQFPSLNLSRNSFVGETQLCHESLDKLHSLDIFAQQADRRLERLFRRVHAHDFDVLHQRQTCFTAAAPIQTQPRDFELTTISSPYSKTGNFRLSSSQLASRLTSASLLGSPSATFPTIPFADKHLAGFSITTLAVNMNGTHKALCTQRPPKTDVNTSTVDAEKN